jgi:hypothetical protein
MGSTRINFCSINFEHFYVCLLTRCRQPIFCWAVRVKYPAFPNLHDCYSVLERVRHVQQICEQHLVMQAMKVGCLASQISEVRDIAAFCNNVVVPAHYVVEKTRASIVFLIHRLHPRRLELSMLAMRIWRWIYLLHPRDRHPFLPRGSVRIQQTLQKHFRGASGAGAVSGITTL